MVSIIKKQLKKSDCIKNIYLHIVKDIFSLLYAISPALASRYLYRRSTGKKLNLKNPKDFNEKLQWLKLYWQHPLVVKCADKYTVREYVENCGCGEILNELYDVYEDTSQITWDNLPQKFAIKCTHGCGFNVICVDKSKLDKDQTINKLDTWLKIKYGRYVGESHYDKMKPRIICERYIETDAGLLPNDYKIYCFNGKPEFVLVCGNRNTELTLHFMDSNWLPMNIGIDKFSKGDTPVKPDSFNLMFEFAEKLAAPFPFVRVDFYDFNGKPLLGEMTFTPAGCQATYYSEYGLNRLGELLVLPEKYAV